MQEQVLLAPPGHSTAHAGPAHPLSQTQAPLATGPEGGKARQILREPHAHGAARQFYSTNKRPGEPRKDLLMGSWDGVWR